MFGATATAPSQLLMLDEELYLIDTRIPLVIIFHNMSYANPRSGRGMSLVSQPLQRGLGILIALGRCQLV